MTIPASLSDGTTIRVLSSHEDRAAAVRLQTETWGADNTERVAATVLMIAEKIGGVASGAFAPDGTLSGFIFGLTGIKDGHLVHWSDMLAVRPEARGNRLGEALKQYQRERCRALGVETMFWTFDPLVARNAHLNLNKLGAGIAEFVPDMYGHTGSHIHSLGTDRFVAAWPLQRNPVKLSENPRLLQGSPIVADGSGSELPLPDSPNVVVAVPYDLPTLVAADRPRAQRWQLAVRRALSHYFTARYIVTAFVPGAGGDAHYLFSKP